MIVMQQKHNIGQKYIIININVANVKVLNNAFLLVTLMVILLLSHESKHEQQKQITSITKLNNETYIDI